jgi:hypothetical protein
LHSGWDKKEATIFFTTLSILPVYPVFYHKFSITTHKNVWFLRNIWCYFLPSLFLGPALVNAVVTSFTSQIAMLHVYEE